MGGQEWSSEVLSETPVLCQQSGGKPGVTFTSAKGEVFSVLEWAPGNGGGVTHCLSTGCLSADESSKTLHSCRLCVDLKAPSAVSLSVLLLFFFF